MKIFFPLLLTILVLAGSGEQKEPVLKIGLIADPQYAGKPAAGTRFYNESLRKVVEAIDTFNFYRVDFVQNLGDVTDGGWANFDSILPLYKKLNVGIENHHLLGNHDFAVDSVYMGGLTEKLSMPGPYYSYSEKGWRFIVLDATDYSYYSNPLHKREIGRVDFYFENTKGKPNHQTWNGAIGAEQQTWLNQELETAKGEGEKVILFSHLPLRPLGNPHNLWNEAEIIRIIENNPNVVAYINGHNHAGGYELKNSIHYITVSGMVETMKNSYGILEIYVDSLVLRGYGNQKTLYLKYP
jgi:hypothetical protein